MSKFDILNKGRFLTFYDIRESIFYNDDINCLNKEDKAFEYELVLKHLI